MAAVVVAAVVEWAQAEEDIAVEEDMGRAREGCLDRLARNAGRQPRTRSAKPRVLRQVYISMLTPREDVAITFVLS